MPAIDIVGEKTTSHKCHTYLLLATMNQARWMAAKSDFHSGG